MLSARAMCCLASSTARYFTRAPQHSNAQWVLCCAYSMTRAASHLKGDRFDTPPDNAGIRIGQAMRAAGCHE
jgi:hypothetical protein